MLRRSPPQECRLRIKMTVAPCRTNPSFDINDGFNIGIKLFLKYFNFFYCEGSGLCKYHIIEIEEKFCPGSPGILTGTSFNVVSASCLGERILSIYPSSLFSSAPAPTQNFTTDVFVVPTAIR